MRRALLSAPPLTTLYLLWSTLATCCGLAGLWVVAASPHGARTLAAPALAGLRGMLSAYEPPAAVGAATAQASASASASVASDPASARPLAAALCTLALVMWLATAAAKVPTWVGLVTLPFLRLDTRGGVRADSRSGKIGATAAGAHDHDDEEQSQQQVQQQQGSALTRVLSSTAAAGRVASARLQAHVWGQWAPRPRAYTLPPPPVPAAALAPSAGGYGALFKEFCLCVLLPLALLLPVTLFPLAGRTDPTAATGAGGGNDAAAAAVSATASAAAAVPSAAVVAVMVAALLGAWTVATRAAVAAADVRVRRGDRAWLVISFVYPLIAYGVFAVVSARLHLFPSPALPAAARAHLAAQQLRLQGLHQYVGQHLHKHLRAHGASDTAGAAAAAAAAADVASAAGVEAILFEALNSASLLLVSVVAPLALAAAAAGASWAAVIAHVHARAAALRRAAPALAALASATGGWARAEAAVAGLQRAALTAAAAAAAAAEEGGAEEAGPELSGDAQARLLGLCNGYSQTVAATAAAGAYSLYSSAGTTVGGFGGTGGGGLYNRRSGGSRAPSRVLLGAAAAAEAGATGAGGARLSSAMLAGLQGPPPARRRAAGAASRFDPEAVSLHALAEVAGK
jgi:hypothetical protein